MHFVSKSDKDMVEILLDEFEANTHLTVHNYLAEINSGTYPIFMTLGIQVRLQIFWYEHVQ